MEEDESSEGEFDIVSLINDFDEKERKKRKISKGKPLEDEFNNNYSLIKDSSDNEIVSEPFFGTIKKQFVECPETSIVKENLEDVCKDRPCFILRNVLSKEECKILIEASEKCGFQNAESYCHMYRDRFFFGFLNFSNCLDTMTD
jgi:hypothetical protein